MPECHESPHIEETDSTLSAERLQKVLASAGIASRRDCEEYIAAGRVMVNGKVVRIPGTRVDPEHDEILVDGRPIGKIHHRTYVMLHKPAGVVSTTDDPQGRPTVVDLVNLEQRLFPVGRLDYDSEGLLLLTDDGELTQRLTHPSYQVEKEYRVLLNEAPSPAALRAWRTGVELDGVKTAPAWAELIERTPDGAWVRVILHEGRKRQIREVARVLGYEVRRLIRVREGPLTLGDLPSGTWRFLTDEEVDMLREHAERNAAVAEAEQPRRREQGETQVSGGRRLRRITPSARLLQKGDQAADTLLPELDEAVEREQTLPPVVDEGHGPRDNERIRRDERPSRDVRHSGRDRYGREQRDRRGSGDGRGERREERSGGYRERREERGMSGPRDFRRDERGGGYRERREERGTSGPRDFRRDERGGGYRERREERGANGPRDFRRDERGGGYRERRDERGANGPRDFRRDERGGGYRERRDERGANGPRDFRRDERGGGYRERREERGGNGPRDFRRDERSGGYRERRDERGTNGPRDFRRDERGGGYRERRDERGTSGPRDFRRDERGGGYRERREERGGYRGERRNDRSSRGFSGNDRPAPRSFEEEEE
jgi:23S rRNA pseudouridine2605 synthase